MKKSENGAVTDATILDGFKSKFLQAINDDLNMPVAMSVLWDMIRSNSISAKDKLELAADFDNVFGLKLIEAVEKPEALAEIPEEVSILAAKRLEAKKSKDFKLADEIRNEIKNLGYEVVDTKDGFSINKSAS